MCMEESNPSKALFVLLEQPRSFFVYESAKRLIKLGADPNYQDRPAKKFDHNPKKISVLHLAASRGQEATTKLLLNEGARIDVIDSLGLTPLHYAANYSKKSNQENFDLLVEYTANVNVQDKLGRTPLHLALQNKQHWFVGSLLFAGADETIKTNKDETVFHFLVDGHAYAQTGLILIQHMYLNCAQKDELKNLLLCFKYARRHGNHISSAQIMVMELLYRQRAKLLLPYIPELFSRQATYKLFNSMNQQERDLGEIIFKNNVALKVSEQRKKSVLQTIQRLLQTKIKTKISWLDKLIKIFSCQQAQDCQPKTTCYEQLLYSPLIICQREQGELLQLLNVANYDYDLHCQQFERKIAAEDANEEDAK